ncbi:MAG TPA: YqgE/AlgH family protein [Chromatiales bacterium]|nr:YqgE/AlgH family protein [Thiotrichales bacterium]HIP69113.1 YqgE/AlgH family protein [Chromatiales bacterium]
MSNMQLANHFLIAMPDMADPNFAETLTLICEHNDDGALGFVINRPTDIPIQELFEQQGIEFDPQHNIGQEPIHFGGPVHAEQGFVLHSSERTWDTTLSVSPDFKITASRDIISAVAKGEGPGKVIFLLGYAGWGPGQLEEEISANAWLTTEADPGIVFNTPVEQRWQAAAQRLGIDLNLINTDAGHA